MLHWYKTVLAAGVFACALTVPGAAGEGRLLVLNAGNEPIFRLRVGHAVLATWGPDLLPYDQAIDVSRGRDVPIAVDPGTCAYDVEAIYGDGDTQIRSDVDLCRAGRVRFDH
jgi:hypothetical protein